MKADIEALLFATDTPLTQARLKALFKDVDGKALREAIDELNADYETQERSFSIVEFGGGWQLATRPEYASLIQRLYRGKRYVRLSQAALEVLAIIAYRQPVTRMEIEEIRGVQVSGVLATLSERNLITVAGRSEAVGNPILYGTTREFLNYMGLKGLHQLPGLPELEGLIDDRDGLKQFAAQLGAEVNDEDLETVAVHGDEIVVVRHDEAAEAEEGDAPVENAPDEPLDETSEDTGEDATDALPESETSDIPEDEAPEPADDIVR